MLSQISSGADRSARKTRTCGRGGSRDLATTLLDGSRDLATTLLGGSRDLRICGRALGGGGGGALAAAFETRSVLGKRSWPISKLLTLLGDGDINSSVQLSGDAGTTTGADEGPGRRGNGGGGGSLLNPGSGRILTSLVTLTS